LMKSWRCSKNLEFLPNFFLLRRYTLSCRGARKLFVSCRCVNDRSESSLP
jgi:hypothetical protein